MIFFMKKTSVYTERYPKCQKKGMFNLNLQNKIIYSCL